MSSEFQIRVESHVLSLITQDRYGIRLSWSRVG
jgi:hypothetical protein